MTRRPSLVQPVDPAGPVRVTWAAPAVTSTCTEVPEGACSPRDGTQLRDRGSLGGTRGSHGARRRPRPVRAAATPSGAGCGDPVRCGRRASGPKAVRAPPSGSRPRRSDLAPRLTPDQQQRLAGPAASNADVRCRCLWSGRRGTGQARLEPAVAPVQPERAGVHGPRGAPRPWTQVLLDRAGVHGPRRARPLPLDSHRRTCWRGPGSRSATLLGLGASLHACEQHGPGQVLVRAMPEEPSARRAQRDVRATGAMLPSARSVRRMCRVGMPGSSENQSLMIAHRT